MAHFAELDENNTVLRVIVVSNDDCGGGDFPESEPIGQAFIESLGLGGRWKQTSYNNNFRKNGANIGAKYLEDKDVFTTIKQFESWRLNLNDEWEAPLPKPSEDGYWEWNEAEQKWQR
jgi:hypothetical protein